jgi:hypothetical protein
LDLPPDIRNKTYALALLDSGEEHMKFETVGPEGRILPFDRGYQVMQLRDEMTIATLDMLDAMNSQIRTEARRLFWAKLSFEWAAGEAPQHEALRRFLMIIGSDGRAAIPEIRKGLITRVDPSPEGHASFRGFLPLMPTYESDDTIDYETWIKWHNEKYPRGLDLDGAALVQL